MEVEIIKIKIMGSIFLFCIKSQDKERLSVFHGIDKVNHYVDSDVAYYDTHKKNILTIIFIDTKIHT